MGNELEAAGSQRLADERLKLVLELSAEWYWEQDESFRFTLLIGAGFRHTGLEPKEYLGKSRWDFDAVPLGDDGSWDRHKAVLEARQPFADFIFRRIDERGELRYISTSGQPMFEGDRFTGYRGIARDVTRSQRAEQLLRLEHMIARCVAGAADSASAALKSVLAAIGETQGWECGRYFGWNEENKTLFMQEFWHVPSAGLDRFIEKSRDISYGPGVGLVGEVFRSGQPLWVTDIEKDPRISKGVARDAGMHGTIVFPVVSEGRPIGVLSFHSHNVREPDERLLQAVGVIGSQIGQFLQRKQAEERIQYLATHDGLTLLPNRVMFSQLLKQAIRSARRYRRSFALLFVDLDRFKAVNDTLGHDAGDKLLQEIAMRFCASVRESDVVARLGGDEFVLLLQEADETGNVTSIADKILSAAMKPFVIAGQDCRVTASIGICMYPQGALDEQSLMKNADLAMYAAKQKGKNNFQFYSADIPIQSRDGSTLETSLPGALQRDELFLHYQAKLDFATGQITGAEALLRWHHPELGLLLPARFMPVAERTGLIVPIGRWVLQRACSHSVAWQQEGLPPVCVAVNLSAQQFAQEDLVEDIAAALQRTGIRPDLLELELAESVVMLEPARAAKVLAAIKQLGVRIAIADFGVGYSSLTQIKRYSVDTLKVNRSFIQGLAGDAEDRTVTQAIIAMGKTLNLTVVAEGVETEEQQAFLIDNACDAMQGYHFSRPLPEADFADLLRRRGTRPK